MSRREAIDIAIDALAKPGIASLLSVGPLPSGIKSVLRIVADGEWRSPQTEHVYRQHDAETVRAASAAFLATVLFDRASEPYRVLGLPKGAALDEVRENKRLLLKWLHPDRNPRAREQEFLSRVIAAAEAIETGKDSIAPRAGAKPNPRNPPAAQPQPKNKPSTRRADAAVPRGAVKRALVQAVEGSWRAAKRTALAATMLVAGLAVWRYVMNEPIGASLTRYSKLALGMLTW